MDTKLDNLFALLGKDSSPAARKAAAQQIGEVQRNHPYDLQNLLERAHHYLRQVHWDTQIAASQAIEAISAHVPKWEGKVKSEEASSISNVVSRDVGRLTFQNFDVRAVMSQGRQLLASAGTEYERGPMILSPEQLAQQRAEILKALGLSQEDDAATLFKEEDLSTNPTEPADQADAPGQDVIDQIGSKAVSSRMRNQLRRKQQKAGNSFNASDISTAMSVVGASSDTKKTKAVLTEQPQDESKVVMETVMDVDRAFEDVNEWPFERFCDELSNELFDCNWNVRHGAALGLREILKTHISSAGRRIDLTIPEQDESNRSWMIDCYIRLLCVMILDRYTDYSGDMAVSHVREASVQAMAIIMSKLQEPDLEECLNYCKLLATESPHWQMRHSGFLILKYLIGVRPLYAEANLFIVLPCLFGGLNDIETQVKGAAADAVFPLIRRQLKDQRLKESPENATAATSDSILNEGTCSQLIDLLSDLLLQLDDITSATSNVMLLLSSLCQMLTENPHVHTTLDPGLIISRLLPFFRYAIRSVRNSVLLATISVLSFESTKDRWLPIVAQGLFQALFQNFVFEEDPAIVQLTHQAWIKLCYLSANMIITLQAEDGLFEAPLTAEAVGATTTLLQWFQLYSTPLMREFNQDFVTVIPFPTAKEDDPLGSAGGVSDRKVASAECYFNVSTALAWFVSTTPYFAPQFVFFISTMLNGLTGSERIAASLLITKWSRVITIAHKAANGIPNNIQELINTNSLPIADPRDYGFPEDLWNLALQYSAAWETQFFFDETNSLLVSMRRDAGLLVKHLSNHNVSVSLGKPIEELSNSDVTQLFGPNFAGLISKIPETNPAFNQLKNIQHRALDTVRMLEALQESIYISVSYFTAASVIAISYGSLANTQGVRTLPSINHVVKPLLAALAKQSEPLFQSDAANSMAMLMKYLCQANPKPCELIIKRLIVELWVDPAGIPALKFAQEVEQSLVVLKPANPKKRKAATKKSKNSMDIDEDGEIEDDSEAEEMNEPPKSKRSKSSSETPEMSVNHQAEPNPSTAVEVDERERFKKSIAKRGSELAFVRMAVIFGEELSSKLSLLWNLIDTPISTAASGTIEEKSLTSAMVILLAISNYMHTAMKPKLLQFIPALVKISAVQNTQLRALAAQTFATIVKTTIPSSMTRIVTDLLPSLQNSADVNSRRGAALALHSCIDTLELAVLPYLIFLIVPVLGRMSDQDDIVRKTMSFSFATLVKLMPLEAQVPSPPDMPPELVEQRLKERSFLEQLLGGRKIDPYEMPIRISTELRSYQKDGVNWLAFLNKYNLHGILADDMGLGKTLQTICIISSDYHYRQQEYLRTKSPEFQSLPGLIVCPPILVPHWEGEVKKFCDSNIKVAQYKGTPTEREEIRRSANKFHLIVTSYDVLRNDIAHLSTLNFNYCVLDEGHIIRNAKTKVTQAVKRIRANHRLILTGTPIQNNVLELWSLFDFLMPGFLGSERQFIANYSKPVMASRDATASSKEQEQGMLVLEALHRQVLPFILRRMKEDVLQDLPPKIIQDVTVELSPLQLALYSEFSKHNAPSADESDSKHIFQSLQYLRKLASHPKLVLTPKHPHYLETLQRLMDEGQPIDSYTHSPKLVALIELLTSCGIGLEKTGMDGGITQNRVLIFAQLKQMLDIVEKDLFNKHMPNVSYLRLDGDVPQNARMPIVEKFNSNPSYDVLLLTVSVGGLGLNLTGANTVIFLEHDWNPQNDIQAMDRVHRIGQKKTVNVYRLITKGTLEEKIMGLQRFKLQIAGAVVNKENQSFQSMDTSALLDLFNYTENQKANDKTQAVDEFGNIIHTASSSQKGLKGILDSLEELGDESRYAEEYNLDNLISKLQ